MHCKKVRFLQAGVRNDRKTFYVLTLFLFYLQSYYSKFSIFLQDSYVSLSNETQ